MTNLEILKSVLLSTGKNYADDFAEGWTRAKLHDTLEHVNLARRKKHLTQGVVDGWKTRMEIYPP